MPALADGTVLRDPSTDEPVFLPAGSEVPSWASELVGSHLLAPDPTVGHEPTEVPDEVEGPSKSWTVAALKAHAAEQSIDLGEATKKDDILAAILASDESPTDDGTSEGHEPTEVPDEQ